MLPVDRSSEAGRRASLQAMGIQLWYPRFELPNAPVVHHPELDVEVAQPQIPVLGVEVAQPQIPVLMDALPTEPEPARNIAEPTPPVVRPAAAADTAADVSHPCFSFAYLAVSPSLAVICEIPYHSRGSLQSVVRQLLSRILKALGVAVQPGSTQVIHFQWPLAESDYLDKSLESARQTLQGFLRRQLSDSPAAYLLVFSEQWPDYLFSRHLEPRQELFDHPQFAVQVLVTRGLYAMAEDESLKAPAWKQMQALKSALAEFGADHAPADGEG